MPENEHFFFPVLKCLEYPEEADMSVDYDDTNLSRTARKDHFGVILKAMHFFCAALIL